ncbi:LCP family protein [Facklamia hominis]|uniref:LCP family protein n=1 Tax=Facklamia hominis TaxID=178214 RepID=A0AAJ1V1E1_9LACT|nr:LCP family protein [Facklamia hominis]MDK7186425.1 LCP family protein [Facklamia hominis]WPJ91699.1 LCP family protein [Facklamia hominis]
MKSFNKLIIVFMALVTFTMSLLPSVYATDFNKPFSILLMGIDSGGLGRTEKGRSDVMMVATVNPDTQEIAVTSIPRDSYVEIPGRGMDKINHAYAFGGPELSLQTVQNWLGIELNDYAVVDMQGLVDMIDSVDGIDIVPPESFEIDGYQFEEGKSIHLDGDSALAYSRERYNSGGDYARQERQRQIILSFIDKVRQESSDIPSMISVINSLRKFVKTNVSMIDVGKFALKHSDFNPNIEFNQLQGQGFKKDGIYYEQIDESSLAQIKDIMTRLLENEES